MSQSLSRVPVPLLRCAQRATVMRLLSSGARWQHNETLKQQQHKPIREHKHIPDGMEGIIDGLDTINESLVFSSVPIGDILKGKASEWSRTRPGADPSAAIVSVSEDSTVFDAIKLMTEKKIGAVLVHSANEDEKAKDKKYIGILTERDYMTKVALNGLNSRTTKVGRIMTSKPITARADETCLVGLRMMTSGRFRHIPVTENGKVIGILSLGDLVKSILVSFKESVDYLSEYIGGTGVAGKDETLLKH